MPCDARLLLDGGQLRVRELRNQLVLLLLHELPLPVRLSSPTGIREEQALGRGLAGLSAQVLARVGEHTLLQQHVASALVVESCAVLSLVFKFAPCSSLPRVQVRPPPKKNRLT